MEKFRTVTYEVHNPKIKKSVRFAVLADLHGSIFGEENSALLKKIQENAPDAILLAGDMVVRMDPSTLETARKLLCTLAKNFPHLLRHGKPRNQNESQRAPLSE